MRFYLLQSKINGIKSINKEITIDYYNNTVTKELDIMNNHVKAIYGPNGAGKTAIIYAMDIYKSLCLDPSYLTIANSKGLLRDLVNQNNELLIENTFCVLNNNENVNEGIFKHKIKLSYVNNQFEISKEYYGKLSGNKINLLDKYITIFDVENGNIVELLNNLDNKDELIETTKNLLKQKSFLSIYKKSLCNNSINYDLNAVFDSNVLVLSGFTMSLNIVYERSENKYLNKIQRDELDSYKRKIKNTLEFIKVFKNDLVDIEVKPYDNGEYYECENIMVYENGSRVNLKFESTGIKKIIELYDALNKVENGYIVFIDEFDANIHDVLLMKIVEYILNYSKGQFIFTIHNMAPMDLLQYKKHGIDFLSPDSRIVPWVKNGNYKASSLYRQGYIEYSPFNIESFSFLGKFGDDDL